jgi:hypothetical protein
MRTIRDQPCSNARPGRGPQLQVAPVQAAIEAESGAGSAACLARRLLPEREASNVLRVLPADRTPL